MNAGRFQFEAEETILRQNLRKAGYKNGEINYKMTLLKNGESRKTDRNLIIRELAIVLKRRPCGLQAWYVQEMISKVTGLSPKYVQVISNSRN